MRESEASRERRIVRGMAQCRVKRAVDRGLLAPVWEKSCVDCGAPATDYDHRDYTKPLEVEPTCHRCNMRRGPGLPYVRRTRRGPRSTR